MLRHENSSATNHAWINGTERSHGNSKSHQTATVSPLILTLKPDPYPNPNQNPNLTYSNKPTEPYQAVLTLTGLQCAPSERHITSPNAVFTDTGKSVCQLLTLPEQCWGLFWILCSTAPAAGAAGAVFSDTRGSVVRASGSWHQRTERCIKQIPFLLNRYSPIIAHLGKIVHKLPKYLTHTRCLLYSYSNNYRKHVDHNMSFVTIFSNFQKIL